MTRAPTTSGIRGFLEKHPDFDRAELDLTAEDRAKRLVAVDVTRLTAWIASLDDSSRAGVRQAWMVGRVLVAQRAMVPKGNGNVAKWEKALASVLKKLPRTLQLYRQLAEGLDDVSVAMALRESHLDDGLNVVIGRIRNVRNGREPDYKAQKADEDRQAELAVAALDKAVKRACKHMGATWVKSWSNDRLPVLLAAIVAGKSQHESDATEPRDVEVPTPLPEVMTPDEFAGKLATTIAAADNTVDATQESELDSLVEDILASTSEPESESVASNANFDSAEYAGRPSRPCA